MKRLLVATGLVWLSAVLTATLAITRGDWVCLVSAMTAALSGAGWFIAARQWLIWRTFALRLAEHWDTR